MIKDGNKLIEKLKDKIESFAVMYKLAKDIGLNFREIECDYTIYDGWDPNSPSCYSLELKVSGLIFKASINIRDMEYILQIEETFNSEAKNFFKEFYKANQHHERKILSTKFYNFEDNYKYEFSLYCSKQQVYFDLIEHYLYVLMK